MKNEIFTGRESIGNAELWKAEKIAFFASRNASEIEKEKIRCWGRNQAKNGVCFIGCFHSDAEQALLHTALKNGGSAVWILGRSLPDELPREEARAMDEGRLLIVSCFEREHYTAATSRYANHVAGMHAAAIVFASISRESLLFPYYRLLNDKRPNDITRVK